MGWLFINIFMEHRTNKRNFSQLTFSGNWKLYISEIFLGSSGIHMGRIKPSIPFVPSLYPDPKGTEKLVMNHHRSGSVNNASNTCDDRTRAPQYLWLSSSEIMVPSLLFERMDRLLSPVCVFHNALWLLHLAYDQIYQEKSRLMLWDPLIDEVSPKVMLIEWSQACNSSYWSIGTLLTCHLMETNWMVRKKTQPTNKAHSLDGLN